jgi:hypothetical protein
VQEVRQRLVPEPELDQLPADEEMAAHQGDVAVEADARVARAAVGEVGLAARVRGLGRRVLAGGRRAAGGPCARLALRAPAATEAPAIVAAPMPTQSLRVSFAMCVPLGSDPFRPMLTIYTLSQSKGVDPSQGARMILAIADILSAADVAEVRAGLATATFVDGKATAGWAAKLVKTNLQASQGPDLERVRSLVETRLSEHAVFALATRPKTILGPLFSRYRPGHAYGPHVDDALMGGVRTDVAFTLFLSDPEDCEGGELIVDTPAGEEAFKLAAAAS